MFSLRIVEFETVLIRPHCDVLRPLKLQGVSKSPPKRCNTPVIKMAAEEVNGDACGDASLC